MSQLVPVSVVNDTARNQSNYTNVGNIGTTEDAALATANSFASFTNPWYRGVIMDFGADLNIESLTAWLNVSGNHGFVGPWRVQWASAAAPTTWTTITGSRTVVSGFVERFTFDAPVTARYIALGYLHTSGAFKPWLQIDLAYADGSAIPTPPEPEPEVIPPMAFYVNGIRFDNLLRKEFRAVLNEAGEFHFVLSAYDEQATEENLARGNLVQVLIPQIHSTYIWEGLLETGDFDLLKKGEEGAEELQFGGPGTLAIFRRTRMDYVQYEGAIQEVFPEKNVWIWQNSLGSRTEGDIIRRMFDEATHVDRPGYPIYPTITRTFTDDDDSDGVPWGDEEFEGKWRSNIGAVFYDEILRLATPGFVHVEMAPGWEFNAWRSLGRDLTTDVFAEDKVRFEKGYNIVNDLKKGMAGLQWANRAIIKLDDGTYERAAITAPLAPYTQETYIETHSDNLNTARREAQGLMRLREDAQEALKLEVLSPETGHEKDWTPGADGTVKYLPGPSWSDNGQYWLGDIVTVHIEKENGEFELLNTDQRIYAITIYEDPDTGEIGIPIVELNAPWKKPGQSGEQSSLAGGGVNGGGGGGGGGGAHVHSGYQSIGEKNQPDGYAGLDEDGLLDPEQLASGSLTDGYVVTVQSDGSLAFEASSGGTLTVEEDGGGSYSPVDHVVFAGDASVADDGGGQVTVTVTGGGGGSVPDAVLAAGRVEAYERWR